MKRRLLVSSRPRRRRLASALAVVMFFSAIIAFMATSLIGYGMYRRQLVARQVLYNAELSAAESLMERAFSVYTFLGTPTSQTTNEQINSIPHALDEFVKKGFVNLSMDGYRGVVVARPPELVVANRVVEESDTLVRPELDPYVGYAMIVHDFSIMAGARAETDTANTNGSRDLPYANLLKRPGVYVSRSNTTYRVPLLAYAIFYENRLEIDGGADLDVVGRVHTNDDMWLTKSSGYARYHDRITVAGNFVGGLYHWGDWGRRTWSGIDDINLSFSPNTSGNRMSPTSNMRKIRHNASQNATDGTGSPLAASIYNNGWLSSWNYLVTGGNPLGRTEAINNNIDPITGIDMDTGELSAAGPRWTANPQWASLTMALFAGPNGILKLQDQATGAVEVNMPIADAAEPRLLIESPDPVNDLASHPFLEDKKKVNLGYMASIIVEPAVSNIHDPAYKNATTQANGQWPANALRAYRLVKDSSEASGYRKDYFSLTYRRTGDPAGNVRSFVTAPRIFNGREEKWVTTIDVDMGKLAEYLQLDSTNADGTNPKFTLNHPDPEIDDGIVYVNTPTRSYLDYTSGQFGVPNNPHNPASGQFGEQLGARLSNASTANLRSVMTNSGASAMRGITFASNGPMYTKGHVNELQADEANPTRNQGVPLMIAGDSINILSPSFNDSQYQTTGSNNNGANRSGSNTITNAVFVGGNVPTIRGHYGGGAENYFRYLEGGSRTHFYRGSVINLWESNIATGKWDKNPSTSAVQSGYYGAPRRNWGWDVNYASSLPPPGVPSVQWDEKGRWSLVTQGEVEAALQSVGRAGDGDIGLH